jgi:glycosyltransferase involved in cell wall biosynthesis
MKISVAVRTKFHAFQLAEQLYQKNVLHKLYTSFYGKIFHLNNSKGFSIPTNKISENWLTALLFYGFDTQNLHIFQYFGRCVAQQLGQENMIVSFPMISLPILQRAKQLGIKTVISHASAHTIAQKELLFEAYEKAGLNPTILHKQFNQYRQDLMLEEYEQADYIQVPSKFVEKSFLDAGFNKNKLLYLPLGVDLQLFNSDNSKKKEISPSPIQTVFKIIYVGQLTIRKGLIDLLKVFHELNLPYAELHLIGALSNEIKPYLQKYVRRVVYHGILSQTQVAEKLQNSDIFVINAVEDGFAQVVPQAMACGLPVICTQNVGGADLVIHNENGFVIPIHDNLALQEKILYFYENREKCHIMGAMAQTQVKENYTWQKYGERCVNTYKQILKDL